MSFDPLTIPDDEPPEATLARLRPLAEAELAAATAEWAAAGQRVLATGVDGSLGTGSVWPSSDADVLIVTETEPTETIQWRVRDGLIAHRHVSGWPALVALREGYPQSFVDTAAAEWFRDPTWMLDGLATFAPVHDPEGRLADLRAFFAARRFAPEVVAPRRTLLLKRAAALGAEAGRLAGDGEGTQAERRVEWAVEALALVWLEADARLISHKETDPALASACAALGDAGAHALFRQATGLPAAVGDRETRTVRDAARHALAVYSRWLDAALARPPGGVPAPVERMLHRLVYLRHRLWASALAPARGCWMHLAADRTFYAGVGEEVGSLIASDAGAAARDDFARALAAFRASLPLTDLPARRDALAALQARTEEVFGVTC